MANPEFRKTILIGLGGAGQLILMNAKRLFLDTYGVVPPSVKFLSLDTDSAQGALRSAVSEEKYGFEPHEFLDLKVPEPRSFIEAGGAVKSWYVKPVPVGAIANGAGAVRQNGRLAFFSNLAEFLNRIDTLITELGDQRLPTRMESTNFLAVGEEL